MNEEEPKEVVVAIKPKKPRTEAQISATKRAFESLQIKRKEKWELKKKELISNEVKQENIVLEKPMIVPVVPDWAKQLSDKVDDVCKKITKKSRTKRIVEESDSSSDEEVIVVRKKIKVPIAPIAPIAPIVPVAPVRENPLKKLLYRN